MKKWKYTVKVFDDNCGFDSELKYDDLKVALKVFCKFVTMDCDIVTMFNNEGVLLNYVK